LSVRERAGGVRVVRGGGMRIISFAWTTEALLKGLKTVTRRFWVKCHVKHGELAQAFNKSARFGGKKVAIIKVLSVRQEPLEDITEDELIKEGNLWKDTEDYIEQFLKGYPKANRKSLIFRIEFELIVNCRDWTESIY